MTVVVIVPDPPFVYFGLVVRRTTCFGSCRVCKSPSFIWHFWVFLPVFGSYYQWDYLFLLFKLIIQIFIAHFCEHFHVVHRLEERDFSGDFWAFILEILSGF